MIAFIGLGNVGDRYARTKHNFGFWVVDELAHRLRLRFKPGKGDYIYTKDTLKKVFLGKPVSGMNRSGIPVKEMRDRWNISLEDLHIIVDDVDLPLGVMRIRPKGGDGCHRGMESVIYHLEESQFPRIRMGIAADNNTRPAEEYVLKPFRRKDRELVERMINRGADAVESILERGIEKTMSEYNRIEEEVAI